MKQKINKDFQEIIKAARAGGAVVRKYFGKNLEITGKTIPADFKTKADMESEEVILKILTKKFPSYNIISEETGEINKNSEYTFIIDPLDGTNNFVLGIPYFSVAIGLVHKDEIIFGVVYEPVTNNIYYAEKGKGAYLNGKKIICNKEKDIQNSTISVVVSYGCPAVFEDKIIADLNAKNIKRTLKNWSCLLDMCLLASGKIEAVIMDKISLHDFIAAKIIAKEAGVLITEYSGDIEKNDKNDTFLATNGTKIHKEILKVLQ